MKLVGLMPVRNEAWCLGLSARVALSWCDSIIVGLHECTDLSETIVDQIIVDERPDRIVSVHLPMGEWREMEHRQILLDMARHEKATHIAIIDADEVLTANLLTTVWSQIKGLSRGFVMQLPGYNLRGYNLRGSLDRYHANGIWGQRWFSVAFADDPALHWGGDRFHAREPQGMKLRTTAAVGQGAGGVMHLWGVSERRLKAKHALYKITERLRWPEKSVEEIDQMYSWAIHGDLRNRSYGNPGTWAYSEVPAAWWGQYREQWGKYLDIEAEPWQTAECKRLIDEYGPEPFSRLDLFGVV